MKRIALTFRSLTLPLLAGMLFLFGSTACSLNKTAKGTLTGSALGAGVGAIVGSATGNAGAGTAIGAGVGALGGALVGNQLDEQDRQNQALQGQLTANQRRLEENRRLIAELRRRGADVRNSKRGVVVNLPDILFEFDSFRLTPEAQRTVGEIGGVIRGVQNRMISVEGHTDSIGTVTYNKRLSVSRARSVAGQLRQNGVPSGQMRVRGFGEGSPIATNNSPEGRSRNRRVEVIIEN